MSADLNVRPAWTELEDVDLNHIVRHIPKDVRELMRDNRLFVAGGFIRELICGGKVNDIDLFGLTPERMTWFATSLKMERPGAEKHVTQYAETVLSPPRMPVQFIKRWCYSDPEVLLSELDFTICQAVVWYEEGKWRSKCRSTFYSDLAGRRLVYTHPQRDEAAGGSMMRVRKFLARGYRISAIDLAGVMSRMVYKVRSSGLVTEDGEQGIAKVLSGMLLEVDPLVVVDGLGAVDETEKTDA